MNCEDCGKDLSGKRADARFCNDTCKKRWQRKQKPAGKRGRPRKSSGLLEGASSTSSPSAPDQGTDVPPVPILRESAWDRNKEKILEAEKNWTPPKLPEVGPTLSEADNAVFVPPVPIHEVLAKADPALLPKEIDEQIPSLAQSVLSRLSSKLPSSAPVIPRGTPILPPTKK